MRNAGRFAFLSLFTLFLMISLSMVNAVASGPAPKFVQKATIGGQFEILSSQLALQKASADSIKEFAQQMVEDHTKSGDQLNEVVASSLPGMQPPSPELDAKHSAMITQLQGLSGKAFDRKYVKDQVSAHKEAVALFKSYAKDGDNEGLKNFAGQTLPMLQGHLDRITQIKNSL
ncbi:MAG: DUF4142 domain-containing protein [Alphaproteobacteria bacterium]|nr:DUF4142 domain-containing protein [Alphaproteobacteria bacterium]